MSARWINPGGYVLRPTGTWEPGAGYLFGLTALFGIRRRRRQYEFTLYREHPLTFTPEVGVYIRPDRHGLTDLGSIPEQLEPLFPRNQYEAGYIMHDSACREHGLYFSSHFDGPYTFGQISSRKAAQILKLCTRAEGANRLQAHLIYRAVDRFGPQWGIGDPLPDPRCAD